MQPTFTNFPNELNLHVLWDVASVQAAQYEPSHSRPKEEFVCLAPFGAVQFYLIRAMKLTLPVLLGEV